jgi:tetratricopeptide (TPR) repeat protein
VVGHVLWGQALINVGKAAEAMRQFDQATGIDKENPHAYNLIGETLLRKGLFRSALPILRKAAALQPNDGRIAQWLDQAKAALAGGPAPVLYDETTVTMALPESLAPLPRPPAPPPTVQSVRAPSPVASSPQVPPPAKTPPRCHAATGPTGRRP